VRIFALAAAGALLAAGCGDSTSPGELSFAWSDRIAQGDQLEIKGINGSITVALGPGPNTEVTAQERGDRNDPDSVTIEVVRHSGGVTICAVYPDVPGQPPNVCLPGDQGHMSVQDNDVEVDFAVALPAAVEFSGQTINGNVTAGGLFSNAFLETINGVVQVSTTQLATAQSVNGWVNATIGLTTWDRDLTFASVNDDVTVGVPAATNAEVRLTTANGSVNSDFSEVVEVGPNDWRGTLGSGGRHLTLATANGNVALRRGP
jgi:DUF4097 and DUF4098 domain-containing protein YvlB